MEFTLTDRGRRLAEVEIEQLEAMLDARLPDDYRRFLQENNGGSIEDGQFGKLVIEYFYGIHERDDVDDIYRVMDALRDEMPVEVIPIAHCAFGDKVCLAVSGPNRGRVYAWEHEGGAPVDDPWLALRGKMFPERYGDDSGSAERSLDWPERPDLTLVAEGFAALLSEFSYVHPNEGC